METDVDSKQPGQGSDPAFTALKTLVPFVVTTFASAALVFTVQPLVGKMLLPTMGGTSVVWNTCLVFFQGALLLGYLYAHLLSSRLPLKAQLGTHAGAFLIAALFLPLTFANASTPDPEQPVGWLLLALTGAVGLPFVVLSASAPLFQGWFARTGHPQSANPYHLYAASNAGSLLSLVAYPAVIEPSLGVASQSLAWAGGFAVLAFLVAWTGRTAWTRASSLDLTQPFKHHHKTKLEPTQVASWVLYSAIPSGLLVAVTTYITSEVASVPLLWMIPLILYLGSFVVVFARRQPIPHRVRAVFLPVSLLVLAVLVGLRVSTGLFVIDGLHHLVVFTVIALVLHGELARRTPAVEHSTSFYLAMSAGGVAGGALVALVAPLAFNGTYEYPIMLAAAGLAMPPALAHAEVKRWVKITVSGVGLIYVIALYMLVMRDRAHVLSVDLVLLSIAIGLLVAAFRKPWVFGVGLGILLALGTLLAEAFSPSLYSARSYFGTYRVRQLDGYNVLVHGRTSHGAQRLDPQLRRTAMTYFSPASGIGKYFTHTAGGDEVQKVAVVGLGVGELATYAGPKRPMTFFEIDPLCEDLARDTRFFHYLSDCGEHCDVMLGDARIRLTHLDEKYDVIVEDAFTSDSVPIHLLTREAFDVYLARLNPDGMLAFHVTNAHLNFPPFIARLAGDAGLHALLVWVTPDELQRGEAQYPAWWILTSRNRAVLEPIAKYDGTAWLQPNPAVPLWTDDFANPLAAYSP